MHQGVFGKSVIVLFQELVSFCLAKSEEDCVNHFVCYSTADASLVKNLY